MREELFEYPMSEDAQQAVVVIHRQNGGWLQLRDSFQNEEGGVVEEFVKRGE
ncbi:hypothetical protein D3C72_2353380 [compost metagenome]